MSRSFDLPIGRPALMGILNVTPDSFSDGGVHFSFEDACAAGLKMREDGADLVDIGGESTRPRAEPVSVDEELRRVMPVLEALIGKGVPVSIDTRKPEVARTALASGAAVLNDVSGLRDPAMVEVAAEARCTVCIMHMLGTPDTMQQNPQYDDVVAEVSDYLVDAAASAQARGVERESVWIDPGIGFGKTVEHNLALLRHLNLLVDTGYPVMVGVSRKSFIGKVLGDGGDPLERLEGTLAAQVLAQAAGARIIRAHDVREARRAIDMAAAILG